MTHKRHPLLLLGAGLLLPLLIIGALLGVVSAADTALQRVPVALVNNDELITEIGDDGEEDIIFASKPLVTELVTGEATDLDWLVTDLDEANRLLALGEVYAVLEIPEDFSAAVAELGGTTPRQAQFTIRTDPSHSYLAGVLADQVGQAIAASVSNEFGREVTGGLFGVVVDLGDAIAEAADAADEVRDGTAELSDGVSELAEGTSELRTGTRDLADGYGEFDDGLGQYLDGVDSLAGGLRDFEQQTRGLPELSDGVARYTSSVSELLRGLEVIVGRDTLLPVGAGATAPLGTITDGIVSGGSELATQTDTAIDGVREGLVDVADGAEELAEAGGELGDGSADLRTATAELADGVVELDDGVQELDDGVAELADGMDEFASGLRDGANEIDDQGLSEPNDEALDTLVNPVVFTPQDRTEEVGLAPTLASIFVPVGIWVSVLLFFLVTPALPQSSLVGSARNAQLIRGTLGPLSAVIAGQWAVALTLLHTLGGAPWSTLAATAPLLALGAIAIAAIHYALWWIRPQLLGPASIALVILQLVTLGVVIPEEVLPGLYQALSGVTPLAWLGDGLLAAVAGGDIGRVVGSSVALGLLALVFMTWAMSSVSRRRRAVGLEALGLSESIRP